MVASDTIAPRKTAAISAASDDGRIKVLDGLRGLAILLVLLHHHVATLDHSTRNPAIEPLVKLASFTFIGVDIFFVMSGFLIGSIILRNGHQPGFLRKFYVRRAARLFPLYALVVALYVASSPFLLASLTPGGDYLARGMAQALPAWSYFLYVQNIFMAATDSWGGIWLAPTWSLAVEEQFYLIAPLLLLVVPRRWLPITLACLVCLSPLIRTGLLLATHSWVPGYVTLPARWDSMFIGILGALAVETPASRRWLEENTGAIMAAFVSLSVVLVYMMLAEIPLGDIRMNLLGFTVIALFALSLVAAALFMPALWVSRLLCCSTLVRLGRISYGVYLLHQPMLNLVRWGYDGRLPRLLDPTDAALSITALTLTVLLATISWHYLEKPILAKAQGFAAGPQPAGSVEHERTRGSVLVPAHAAP